MEVRPLQVCFHLDSELIRAIPILAETSANSQLTCSATLAPLKQRSTSLSVSCMSFCAIPLLLLTHLLSSHSLFKRIRRSNRFRSVLHQLFSIRPITRLLPPCIYMEDGRWRGHIPLADMLWAII